MSGTRGAGRSLLAPFACFVVASLAGAVTLTACAEDRRALGDACLKSDDCLSGVCSGQLCTIRSSALDDAAVSTPLVDADYDPPFDAAPASSSSADGG